MNITDLEKKVIENIAFNLYSPVNGEYPEDHIDTGSWSDTIGSDGPNDDLILTQIPGIVSSLVKKELVTSNNESVMLTEKGYSIFKKLFPK